MELLNRRKDNQGVWIPICIRKYHPFLFQSIQEERVSQQPNSTAPEHIDPSNDEINVLSNSIIEPNKSIKSFISINHKKRIKTILRKKKRKIKLLK